MTVTKRISKSGEKRFIAQVRYKGIDAAQTFVGKTVAGNWERDVKASIDKGTWPDPELLHTPALKRKFGVETEVETTVNDAQPHPGWSIRRALDEYARLIEGEKGFTEKLRRIRAWQKMIGDRRLDDPELEGLLQEHVDDRADQGRAASTVRNDIFTGLGAMYSHAIKADIGGTGKHGWGLSDLQKPTQNLILPPPDPHRDRRLHDALRDGEEDEETRLRQALAEGLDAREMVCLFTLALETSMRLGELLDVKRSEIRRHQDTRIIFRQTSKNSNPRRVTLSPAAEAAVDEMLRVNGENERLFSLKRSDVENRWQSARSKVEGASDLHWHDLRHEALSRLATLGLNLAELKEMSGHKNEKMLMRYINVKPSEIAAKLRRGNNV